MLSGIDMWTISRTLGLSMPMPNADVATMMTCFLFESGAVCAIFRNEKARHRTPQRHILCATAKR